MSLSSLQHSRGARMRLREGAGLGDLPNDALPAVWLLRLVWMYNACIHIMAHWVLQGMPSFGMWQQPRARRDLRAPST